MRPQWSFSAFRAGLPSRRDMVLIAFGLLMALAAGAGFDHMNIPLAWVLGPLTASALLSLSGMPVFSSVRVRRGGQMMIGTGLGLNITAALVTEVFWWIPAMIVAALASIVVSAAVSVFMARMGGLDRRTAYFSLMPGGLVEMANIGESVGARAEPIALTQAIRVALVVLILPPTILALGISGDFVRIDASRALPLLHVAGLLCLGVVGIWLVTLLRGRNPWLMGPLFMTGLLSSLGFVDGQLLPILFNGGQYVLGVVIGSRFKRDIVSRLPLLSLLAVVFTLVMTVLLFAMAAVWALLTPLDMATAALAMSAGGLIEMALTAKILQLNIAMVLGFHLIRAIIVNGFSLMILETLERLRLFDAIERVIGATGKGGPRR